MTDPISRFIKFDGFAIIGRKFNEMLENRAVPFKLFYRRSDCVGLEPTAMIMLDAFIRSTSNSGKERWKAEEIAQVKVHDDAIVKINYPKFTVNDDRCITLSERRPFVPEEWVKKDDITTVLRNDPSLARYIVPRMRDRALRASICDEFLDNPLKARYIPSGAVALLDLVDHLDINGRLIKEIIEEFNTKLTSTEIEALCIRAVSAKNGATLNDLPPVAISLPVVLYYIEVHRDNPVHIGVQIRSSSIGGAKNPLVTPENAIDQVVAALLKYCEWFHLDHVGYGESMPLIALIMLNQRPESVNNIVCSSIKLSTLKAMRDNAPKAYASLKQRLLSGVQVSSYDVKNFTDAYPETRSEF
jgi:hypothetical protein